MLAICAGIPHTAVLETPGPPRGEKGQVRRIRSCGFSCGAVRPSVGDLDGRRRLRTLLAALSGAPFVLLAAGLWAGALAQQAPSAVTPGQIEDRF